MEHCFPIKTVIRHTADKPWITDIFRNLIRKRQRAYKSGNRDEYRVLRNMVNRESTVDGATFDRSCLKSACKKFCFYHRIITLHYEMSRPL